MCDIENSNFNKSNELDNNNKIEINEIKNTTLKNKKTKPLLIRHSTTLIPRMLKSHRVPTINIDPLPPSEPGETQQSIQLKSLKNYKNITTLIQNNNDMGGVRESDENCKIKRTQSTTYDICLYANQTTSTSNLIENKSIGINTSIMELDKPTQKEQASIGVETESEQNFTLRLRTTTESRGSQISPDETNKNNKNNETNADSTISINILNRINDISIRINRHKLIIVMSLLCIMIFSMLYFIAIQKESNSKIDFITPDDDEGKVELDEYGLKRPKSDVWLKYL